MTARRAGVGRGLGEISQRCAMSVGPTHRERAGCERKGGQLLHDPAGLRLPPTFTQHSRARPGSHISRQAQAMSPGGTPFGRRRPRVGQAGSQPGAAMCR